MSRTTRNLILLLAVGLSLCGNAVASSTATITVTQVSTPAGSGSISIAFNGFVETLSYGQFASAASMASTIGALFSRDYLRDGLCAHASGSVVTFQLKGSATFGPLDVNGPINSFQVAATSGWPSSTNVIADHGTVTLTLTGGILGTSTVVAAQTNYGDGATPSTIAANLAAASTANSIVSLIPAGDVLTITAATAGSASNSIVYSLQNTSYDNTDFTQPSFPAVTISGNLEGGANASNGQTPQTIYSYSVPSAGYNGAGYDGTGNLLNYSDSAMGTWSFGYDTLNRLVSAQSTAGGAVSTPYSGMNGCWAYDGFGNRIMQLFQSAACPPPPTPGQPPATVHYDSNNRVILPTDFVYDAAGDVTTDNNGNTYLYDGEGRICAVKSEPIPGTYTMTGYLYDADGTRVSKGAISTWSCDPGSSGYAPTNDYILGLSGEQVTEMVANADSGVMMRMHNNVWAAGKLIATYDQEGLLHFYLDDPLGTRRAQTDFQGALEQYCSSLPFGDGETCSPAPQSTFLPAKNETANQAMTTSGPGTTRRIKVGL